MFEAAVSRTARKPWVWHQRSATAEAVKRGLRASSRPGLQVLASLADDRSRDTIVRECIAVFAGELAARRLSINRAAELQTEADDALFTTVFDRLAAAEDGCGQWTFRSLLARWVQGIERADRPLDETLSAAAIVDGTEGVARLIGLKAAVLKEYRRVEQTGDASASALYGFEGLFDSGVSIQQHFFHDDEDGVESFTSFKQHYERDPPWRWEESPKLCARDGQRIGRTAH